MGWGVFTFPHLTIPRRRPKMSVSRERSSRRLRRLLLLFPQVGVAAPRVCGFAAVAATRGRHVDDGETSFDRRYGLLVDPTFVDTILRRDDEFAGTYLADGPFNFRGKTYRSHQRFMSPP